MLNQLLLEQDIEDRKQIGLFGVKKNQDILGTNQGGMTNNYERQGAKSRSNSGSRLWNMANQDAKYSDVVPQMDYKNSRQRLSNLKSLETIRENSKSGPSMHLFDHEEGLASSHQPIRVDKNCVSCSGYAPQILSQIKVACLSYINSPICFGQETFSNRDLLRVKELILKRLELLNSDFAQVIDIASSYGCLNMNTALESQESLPTPLYQIKKPDNINIDVVGDTLKQNKLNTEEELGYGPHDGSPQSPSIDDGSTIQNHDLKQSLEGKTVFVEEISRMKSQENQFKIQKQKIMLFPNDLPKFNINTLSKLIVSKKDFTYKDKTKLSSKPQEFDNTTLTEDLIRILQLDNSKKFDQMTKGKSFLANMASEQQKLNFKTNCINKEQTKYNNLQKTCVSDKHERVIHNYKREKNSLHISSQGDFMVLGDNSLPPSQVASKQELTPSNAQVYLQSSKYMNQRNNRNRNAAMDLNTVLNNGSIQLGNEGQTQFFDSIIHNRNNNYQDKMNITQISLSSTRANDFTKTSLKSTQRQKINVSSIRAKTPQNQVIQNRYGNSNTHARSKQQQEMVHAFPGVIKSTQQNVSVTLTTQKVSQIQSPTNQTSQNQSLISDRIAHEKTFKSNTFSQKRHTTSEGKSWGVAVMHNSKACINQYNKNVSLLLNDNKRTFSGTSNLMSPTSTKVQNIEKVMSDPTCQLVNTPKIRGLTTGTLNVISGR